MNRFLGLSLAFVLIALAPSAEAQTTSTAQLDYRSDAPGCDDPGGLRDRVAARLGRAAFTADARGRATIRIMATAEGLLATLDQAPEGGPTSTRAFRAATCGELHEQLATALAVALEPRAATPDLQAPASAPPARQDRVRARATANRPIPLGRVDSVSSGWGSAGGRAVQLTMVNIEPLCLQTPCEFEIARGQHMLMVGGVTLATNFERDSAMRIEYEDRTVYRVLGWIGYIAGLVATPIGAVLWAMGRGDQDLGAALTIGGGITFVAGLIGAFLSDSAEVDMTPITF